MKNIGLTIHRLTAVELVDRTSGTGKTGGRTKYYLWQCECGCERTVRIDAVKRGDVIECKLCASARKSARMTTHGFSSSAIYHSWYCMKQRCDIPGHQAYKWYGGRGISYDPRWADFVEFYLDMHDSHFEGAAIDRIENDGNYCKDNCQWLTSSANVKKRHTDNS